MGVAALRRNSRSLTVTHGVPPPRCCLQARGSDLRVHFKNSREAARCLKGLSLNKAKAYMQAVINHKRCVPFLRYNGAASREGGDAAGGGAGGGGGGGGARRRGGGGLAAVCVAASCSAEGSCWGTLAAAANWKLQQSSMGALACQKGTTGPGGGGGARQQRA